MNSITFTNRTERKLTLIVEPVADEYIVHPGDRIEMRPPLYLDHREVVDIQIAPDAVVVFVPEDVAITRNGEPVDREGA